MVVETQRLVHQALRFCATIDPWPRSNRWCLGMGRLMQALLIAALLLPVTALGEVYRWTDSSGVVHYSDRPSGNGVERADLPGLVLAEPPPEAPASGAAQDGNAHVTPAVLRLVQPQPGATLRQGTGAIVVQVAINRELQPGEQLTYRLDGQVVIPASRQTRVQLGDISRGTHQLSVVLKRDGRRIAATDAVTVYLKRPSVISPSDTPASPSTAVPAAPAVNQVGGVP